MSGTGPEPFTGPYPHGYSRRMDDALPDTCPTCRGAIRPRPIPRREQTLTETSRSRKWTCPRGCYDGPVNTPPAR
ncbi:hypothetical protein GCM10009674_03510 [Nesterenkonia xinjiangensis]